MLINWYGAFGAGQGYSGLGENMVKALVKNGEDVRIINVARTPNRNLSKEFKDIKKKPFMLGDIGVFFGFPAGFDSLKNKYKIGFTMFETDKLPSGKQGGKNDWAGITGDAVGEINRMNELWVPCQHNADVFKNNGVTIPIHVIKAGIDATEYKYIERNHEGKPYTFLMLGTLTARKNAGAVLSAFLATFGDNPNVKLVLKTQSGTLGHIQMPNKNIHIIDELISREALRKLYEEADCFVFPTRGEGFGLPPVEAMATGLPCIFADHSGMHEFADDRYNYTIKENALVPAFRYPKNWGNVGNWFEPSYEELKHLMKYVFEHQDEARAKGKQASEWVKENWTTDNTAKAMIERLNNIKV